MSDEKKITIRIPADLHARIEAIRAEKSIRPGDPTGGPRWADVLRDALDEWAQRMEVTR